MIVRAPNFEGLAGLVHGFGLRDSPWPPGVTIIRQIHSDVVCDASCVTPNIEGDALISQFPDALVGIKTADCVPILLVDPETQAVASVHAGWRGTAQGIVRKTILELGKRWGVRPENLRAAVGPAIGACCYEVGSEVAHRFGIETSGTAHLNLAEINAAQLRAAGIGDVWVSGECTYCAPERFFSYRREKEQAGRMLSYIGWQKHDGRAV